MTTRRLLFMTLFFAVTLVLSACEKEQPAQVNQPPQPQQPAPGTPHMMGPPGGGPHTHTQHQRPQEPMVLKSYALPKGYGETVIPLLKSLIERGESHRVGRVSPMPGSQVAILAPASIHAGVEGLFADIAKAGAPPPPQTLAVQYWLVVGRPSKSGATNAADPTFKGFEPALTSINEAHGPTEFALMEQTRLLSLNGEEAESQGKEFTVRQHISAHAGHYRGELEITNHRGNVVKTSIRLETGKLLVVGQAGMHARPDDRLFKDQLGDPKHGERLTLYFIIRAEDVNSKP